MLKEMTEPKESIIEPTLYKHYAKADENGNVNNYFCDKFEEPKDASYFVGEYTTKHVRQVHTLQNKDGIYLHKINEGKVVQKNEATIADELLEKQALNSLTALDSTMPRVLEDVIDALSDTVRGKIAKETLDIVKNK
jgi:hypothetical protein